jgi:hypothetical protein
VGGLISLTNVREFIAKTHLGLLVIGPVEGVRMSNHMREKEGSYGCLCLKHLPGLLI